MGDKRCQELEKLKVKLAESKERLTGMKIMKRKGLGFNYIECFLKNSSSMGRLSQSQGNEEKEVIDIILRKKVRDERKSLKTLMIREKQLKEELKNTNGKRNKNHRRIIKEMNIIEKHHRKKHRKKYIKKIETLRVKTW